MTRTGFFLFFLALSVPAARGAPAPVAFKPYYASQRASQAFLREGPGYAYKVLWVYRHKGYPFQVTASYDIWRRVKDVDGIVGWMSAQMLSEGRTVLVTGKGQAQLRKSEDPNAKIVGLANPGAILSLKSCTKDKCRAAAEGIEGWISRDRIWGAE